MNLHNLFTVNVISGRVQHEIKLAIAMRLRYSVVVVFEEESSWQSACEKTAPGMHGVVQGLQSIIFARSRSTLIELCWLKNS